MMDWLIEIRDGEWLVSCAGIIDSRHSTPETAIARQRELQEGRAAMLALTAAAGDDAEGRPFAAVLAVDDYETADGRYFERFEWATLPLSLWTLDDQGMGGHLGAEASGSIRTIERLSDGRRIFATGVLGTTEEGQQTESQIEQQMIRFVSVDPSDYDADWEILKIDSDGWPVEDRLRFTSYEIGGATVLGSPAIRLAVIWLEGMEAPEELAEPLPEAIPPVDAPEVVEAEGPIVVMAGAGLPAEPLQHLAILAAEPEARALIACGCEAQAPACALTQECGGPVLPPESWFASPGLTVATPITITPEGRMFLHVAVWGQPHRGFLHYSRSDRIMAPHSRQGYAQAMAGSTPVACCDDPGCGHERKTLRTGVLTIGTGHADRHLSAAGALAHYENSGLQVADLCFGEDAIGIWAAGALRPGVSDARVREILGSSPSGDWRWIGGHLELVAVLGVSVPGFLASAYVQEGELRTLIAGWPGSHSEPGEALVASGRLAPRPSEQARSPRPEAGQDALLAAIERMLDRRLGPLERDVAALRPAIAEQIALEIATALPDSPDRVEAALEAVRPS